ncbi:MAG: hypothetical protein ACHQ2Z_14815 [Elusimicrobiota bacterium]
MAVFARGAVAAVLREAAGLVQIRAEGSDRWKPAGRLPRTLAPGDAVRTGFNARAVIALDGGAVLEAGGGTQVSIEETRGGGAANLIFGAARLSARALGGRPLELRTPTVVSKARSQTAAWRATVGGGGNSVLEVEEGLIGVEDARGGALLLRTGERVEVDLAGLHEPTLTPTPARARREDFAGRMRRELELDREPDALQNYVSGEMRREEYELGHVLTDASGRQVRAEEFVVRTSPTSFTFVALNGRRGSGLSYYSWTGVFDVALPKNLAPVFAILPGSAGAPAPWTLTGYTSVSSNGLASLVATAAGGHQVDVNHNADPTDDVSSLYNPATDGFVNVAGQAVYRVLFDRYGLYSDGLLKNGWTGTNIQSQADAGAATTNDPLTGAALANPLPVFTTNTTFPDASSVRQTVLNSYSDGTSITVDNRAVSPGGGTVSRAAFGDATSGPAWQSGLLRSVFEQTTMASEFGGRSIDVMVSPRILIETGGLP